MRIPTNPAWKLSTLAGHTAKFISLCLLIGFGNARSNVLAEQPDIVLGKHFVVNGPSTSLAQEVLQTAEIMREEIALDWFRHPLPDDEPKTVIQFNLSDTDDEGLTWLADRQETKSHFMWLTTSRDLATGSTLAHEMAHICMSWRFPDGMPAWAHEGVASSYDDAERAWALKEMLARYANDNNWPSLERLLNLRKIPPTDGQSYTASVSLVEFLLDRQESRDNFLKFVDEGKRSGWDAALRSHYKIDGIPNLQQQWQAWVTKQMNSTTPSIARRTDVDRKPALRQ